MGCYGNQAVFSFMQNQMYVLWHIASYIYVHL